MKNKLRNLLIILILIISSCKTEIIVTGKKALYKDVCRVDYITNKKNMNKNYSGYIKTNNCRLYNVDCKVKVKNKILKNNKQYGRKILF